MERWLPALHCDPRVIHNGCAMHVMIREVTADDAEALAPLTGELGYPATAEEIGRRLALLAESGGDAVLVAEVDGAVCGWIHIAEVRSLENDPYAEIRGLVVTETLRGQGIGTRLVAAAEEWAVGHGMPRVRVRSNVNRGRTHSFYQRLGYRVTKEQKVFDRNPGA